MYYKKVLIKSEKDLPKKGKYFFHLKNLTEVLFKGNVERLKLSNQLACDYFLQPIDNPEIDLREELYNAFKAGRELDNKWRENPQGFPLPFFKNTFDEWYENYLKSQKQ